MATRRKPMSEINVVPYIDVMLVLLVIFMATAPLLTQGVNVDLPEAPSEAITDTENDPLVVSMRGDGALFMNTGAVATSKAGNNGTRVTIFSLQEHIFKDIGIFISRKIVFFCFNNLYYRMQITVGKCCKKIFQ